MDGEDKTIRICKICREFTISRLICQNCGARLNIKKISKNNSFLKINPESDNIITFDKKRKFIQKLRLEIEKRKREERERKEKERKEKEKIEKERKEKEKIEKERKLILKKVNDKYNNIKNDLPVPFLIDKNQLDKLINSKNDNCLICLEDFIENDQVLYLPCSHLFHSLCVLRWLLNNNKCPICQTDYKNEVIDEEEQNMSMTMNQNMYNPFSNIYGLNVNIPINIPMMEINNAYFNMGYPYMMGYRRNRGGYSGRGRGGYNGRGRGGYNGRGRRGGNYRGRGNYRGNRGGNFRGRRNLNLSGFF